MGTFFWPKQNMSHSFLPVQCIQHTVCGDNLYSVYVNIWGNDSLASDSFPQLENEIT